MWDLRPGPNSPGWYVSGRWPYEKDFFCKVHAAIRARIHLQDDPYPSTKGVIYTSLGCQAQVICLPIDLGLKA